MKSFLTAHTFQTLIRTKMVYYYVTQVNNDIFLIKLSVISILFYGVISNEISSIEEKKMLILPLSNYDLICRYSVTDLTFTSDYSVSRKEHYGPFDNVSSQTDSD